MAHAVAAIRVAMLVATPVAVAMVEQLLPLNLLLNQLQFKLHKVPSIKQRQLLIRTHSSFVVQNTREAITSRNDDWIE